MSLLAFHEIHKSYGETVALCGVSPEVDKGEVFGLLGPNGAGLIQVTVWFGMIVVTAALPFFVAGYLFPGSLILGIGSLGGNLKESQQITIVPSLLAVTPMMFLGILLATPHSLPGLIMTWIPFTAPVMVILRLTLDASGMLLSGARPKFREIIRQARLSG